MVDGSSESFYVRISLNYFIHSTNHNLLWPKDTFERNQRPQTTQIKYVVNQRPLVWNILCHTLAVIFDWRKVFAFQCYTFPNDKVKRKPMTAMSKHYIHSQFMHTIIRCVWLASKKSSCTYIWVCASKYTIVFKLFRALIHHN